MVETGTSNLLPTSILLDPDIPEIEVLLQESRYDTGGVRNQPRADKALAVEMKVHIHAAERVQGNMELTHQSHHLQLRLRS